MEFAAKDCLFIAVDVQECFARTSPALPVIRDLWRELAETDAARWQMLMKTAVHPSRQGLVDSLQRPLLPVCGSVFYKNRMAPTDNPGFTAALIEQKSQAVFLFGYKFEQCLRATARHCRKTLAEAGVEAAIHVIDDCSGPIPARFNLRDRQRLLGPGITLINRDEIDLNGPHITVTDHPLASASVPQRPVYEARVSAGLPTPR